MNLTKFGSLNLDTPRISYDFYKFVAISGKQLKKNIKILGIRYVYPSSAHPTITDSRAPRSTRPHPLEA